MPKRPDTRHLSDLQSLAGNEQLLAVLKHRDQLKGNLNEWERMGHLASERGPAFTRLRAMARHAAGSDMVRQLVSQIEAIVSDRRLLDASDPVPALAGPLADALRRALKQSQDLYDETYDGEWERLEVAESWKAVQPEERERILARYGIHRESRGATGTESEVLESLERISLDGWRRRTAALPQLFADARAEADRLVEPAIHHVKLGSGTLRTSEDVREWVEETERDLLERVEKGPIVIG